MQLDPEQGYMGRMPRWYRGGEPDRMWKTPAPNPYASILNVHYLWAILSNEIERLG
jgi:hypothetical protein